MAAGDLAKRNTDDTDLTDIHGYNYVRIRVICAIRVLLSFSIFVDADALNLRSSAFICGFFFEMRT